MSTKFGKDILKTERLFQLSYGGWEGGREGVSEHPKVLSSATGQRPVAELKNPRIIQFPCVRMFRTLA